MTAIMRKHGKILLAVFGSLLMIVFVLPPLGGNRDTSAAGYVHGKLDGSKVTNRDLYPAARDLQVLQAFGFSVPFAGQSLNVSLLEFLVTGKPSPFGAGYFPGLPRRLPLTPTTDLQVIHWHLLLQEAQRYGIVASEAEVTEVISLMKLTESQMNDMLARLGIGPKSLRQSIADALVLQKLGQLTMNSTQISLPEVEFLANQDLSRIQVAYATLDATKGWESAPEPTDEQIKKQFELYKDVLPTPIPTGPASPWEEPPALPPTIDGHQYPFGYKYPDRVKVEYLRFDKARLAALMKPNADDYDAAFKYYTNNKDQFRNPPENDMAVATRPAVKSWDEVKKDLVQKQFEQRVGKLLRKAADRAMTLANDAWKNVETKEGYRVVPEPAKWADYKKIENEIANNKEYLGFRPEHATTDWRGGEQLAKIEHIGEAYLETPNGRIRFPDFAVRVKDLLDEKPKDALGRFFLQVGPEGPLLTDNAGDIYLYRVTAAEKSHAPASVDEVRAQVIQDLKKLATYEKRQAEARELAEQAKHGDLRGLADARKLPNGASKDITQTDIIPELGHAPGLVEAAFTMTRDPAATQPAKDGKRASATTTFARDAVLKVHVLELINFTPAMPSEFAAQRPTLARQFVTRSRLEFMFTWLNLESTAKRLNYVPEVPFDSRDHDQG